MHNNHCGTIPSLFELQVEKSPDSIALLFAGQSMTYAELNVKSNQYAYYLRELGVKADTLVGLCMDRSIELFVAMLGILKAGGAYVPIDASLPLPRLFVILKDLNAPILITDANFKDSFEAYRDQLLVNNSELEMKVATYSKYNPPEEITSQSLAYVIYTSGSTGTPKGVLIEHKSVVNYAYWFAEYSGCKPQQRIDFSSNHTFDMAVTTSIIALMLGLTVVICQDEIKQNTREYLNHLERNQVNILKLTPSYFKVLLHEVKNNYVVLHSVQSIILGGENLLVIDCVAWHSLYPDHVLFNEYGPTETTVAVTSHKIEHANNLPISGSVPIGKPGTNMVCYILDANLKPVPVGEVGELYIGGTCLARGYLNRADLTQQRFLVNPPETQLDNDDTRLYRTGDLCRQLPDREIEYIDRVDSQVKIRGFRIELAEVNRCITKHPAILDAEVLAQQINNHEKQLIAYCILNPDSDSFDFKELRRYLDTKLAHYMIPTAFVRVQSFPLTENGKLDRDALPRPQFFTNHYYCPPRTPLEKKLVAIWSEELGQKLIGIKHDFFELGGYSLSAARVISNIASQLGKEISLHDFYQAASIAKLAPIVEMAKTIEKKTTETSLIGSVSNPLFPLSDFQLLIWLCNNFEPGAQKINIVIRRRLEGRLDRSALLLAFNLIFKRHEALFYRIYRLRPAQCIQQNLPFDIVERHLQSLSVSECESTLNESISELQYYHPWPKKYPMLRVRLFRLNDDIDELQICISHLVADYVSSEILINDLSKFYLLCCKGHSNINQLKIDRKHREYVAHEQDYLQTHFDKDFDYWQHYLKDASLFAFPEEQVVKNRALSQYSYSSYLEIPELTLSKLQHFCASHCVSMGDGLTAALLLALSSCCNITSSQKKPIFISRVKSTRDNPIYDNTIGCFLRVEGLKLIFNRTNTLASLSQQIHQVGMEMSSHQHALSLIKIASVSTFYKKRKSIRNYLIKIFSICYTSIFKGLQVNSRVLQSCGRLFLYERDNHFLININVQSNLLLNDEKRPKDDLFGLKTQSIKTYTSDLLKAENVFDVCFFRDDNQNTPYIVISAGLQPAFRELIAKRIIEVINHEQQGDNGYYTQLEAMDSDEELIKS